MNGRRKAMSNEEEAFDILRIFALAFFVGFILLSPLSIAHKLEREERRPKIIIAQIESLELLPLAIRKSVLIKWHDPQEIYPTSGFFGFFKDKPSMGWIAFPGDVKIPLNINNEKVWMKYEIKDRGLPSVNILEFRHLK